MPRTWPVLRLTFATPLTDQRRDALMLDVDDCAVMALDEADDVVTLHFTQTAERDAAVDLLAARGWLHEASLLTEELPDEGWAARSQANLPAIRVGRLVVAPPWDRPASPASADVLVIEVEPSTGFGTGHHQSTRLCLQALQSLPLEGVRVLDIGTGSGVLAVAAAHLGAREAVGIDNDPDAIESAEDTLRRNRVPGVRVELRALEDPALAPADVVCANLTGALLRQRGARVQQLIVPGGAAVLSGFTEDEARWVRETFDECDVEAVFDEEFWLAYVMRRRPAASHA